MADSRRDSGAVNQWDQDVDLNQAVVQGHDQRLAVLPKLGALQFFVEGVVRILRGTMLVGPSGLDQPATFTPSQSLSALAISLIRQFPR